MNLGAHSHAECVVGLLTCPLKPFWSFCNAVLHCIAVQIHYSQGNYGVLVSIVMTAWSLVEAASGLQIP